MGRGYFFRNALVFQLIFFLGIGFQIFSPIPLSAETTPVTTEVKHKPIKYFIPGSRIALDASMSDKFGIKLARCYFKADEQAEYVFVPMTETGRDKYRAILPAPADYAEEIRYLFLVVNVNEQVVKTQLFSVEKAADFKEPPAWQEISASEDLSVFTELSQPPETLAGFSDSVAIDAVESSLRFGMVAGIYSASATVSAGSTTGAAAAATSGGSITATAGISTTAVLVTAAGIAAGAGAIVAASDSDSDDEKINPNASISWGDANEPPADTFEAVFGDKMLGKAYEMKTETGLRVGTSELTIRAVSVAEDVGNFFVELGGGAYFRDGVGIRKEGRLLEGDSLGFEIVVPDTGAARIEW